MSPIRVLAPVLAGLGAAAVLAGCGEKRDAVALPAAPVRLEVALDGPVEAPLAPLYAAIGDGGFTRAGLAVSVTARPGEALARVSSGASDIAVASEPALLRARDQGAELVAVGAVVQGPLAAIISIARHPITKITQLGGATVALPGTPLAAAELDAMLRQAGVAAAAVRRRDSGPDPAHVLAAKAADAVLGSWSTDAVRLARRRPTVIKVENAGVPTYNELVLVVRQGEARTRGPVLREFLQALTLADHATVAAPAAAVDQLLAANPGRSRRLDLASLKATLPTLDPAPTGSPYGFVDPRVWRTFGTWMLAHGLLTRPDDAARAVTDEFLPGQGE